MNSATQVLGRGFVSEESEMRVPRDTRRGVIGGIAQFLALLAVIGMLGLWAGRVATHEVTAPAGGSAIENVAPGSLGPQHVDPETGASQLDLTPETADVLPGYPGSIATLT